MLSESETSVFQNSKFQILATVIANVICIGQGASVGWLSPSLPLLLSDNSTLQSGPLSKEEAGWIGSFVPVGVLTGTALFGILANFVGCKISLIFCSVPLIASWLLIINALNPWHIGLARIFAGLTGGGEFLCIALFVAEIADDQIRGRLSSLLPLSFNFGILLGYIAGVLVDYSIVPYVMLSFPTIFLCTFIFFPNSPQYLLGSNRPEEAEKSLRFYRNCRQHTTDDREKQLLAEFEKLKAIANQNAAGSNVSISDFLTKEALLGLTICPVLMAVSQFSGTFTMTNYASTIFRETGSTIDPNLSAIFLGIIQVLGFVCSTSLIDRLGRKTLLLVSTGGGSVALMLTGLYSYLNKYVYDLTDYSVVPIVTLSSFIFLSGIGIISVPYILLAEVLPQKIRRIGSIIGSSSVGAFAFVMLRMFPLLLERFELFGCMWFFGIVAIFGFFFTLFVVSETKGKNLDILEENNIDKL